MQEPDVFTYWFLYTLHHAENRDEHCGFSLRIANTRDRGSIDYFAFTICSRGKESIAGRCNGIYTSFLTQGSFNHYIYRTERIGFDFTMNAMIPKHMD